MEQPTHDMTLELTEEQSRRIESTTGKHVTELQIEIVEEVEQPAVTAAQKS